jgi:hypothetical protein
VKPAPKATVEVVKVGNTSASYLGEQILGVWAFAIVLASSKSAITEARNLV